MNSKEIKEALEIIKKPITVNCIEYKYFDDENYNKLIEVYDNCLWFANNLEQINLIVENFEKENQKLKSKLEASEKARIEAIEFINGAGEMASYTKSIVLYGEEIEELLEILDINKGQ